MAGTDELIDLFPASHALKDFYIRRDALVSILEVVLAARAAIDEITARTDELSLDDRFATDSIAEMLSVRANVMLDLLSGSS